MKKEKILIIADSHGDFRKVESIIRHEEDISCLIHCGDGVNDLVHVNLPEGILVVSVEGNIDHGRVFGFDRMVTLELFNSNIMVTHGDKYGVKAGNDQLLNEARSLSADVVFFGHTHRQYMEKTEDLVLFNPGAATEGCYGIVECNGSMKFYHKKIQR